MRLGHPLVSSAVLALVIAACSSRSGTDGGERPAPLPPPAGASEVVLARGEGGSVKVAAVDLPRAVAEVDLPALATGPVRVRHRRSGMRVEFVLSGARPSPVELQGRTVRYRGAAPGGGDVVHRPGPAGTEDFVAYERRPAVEEAAYDVDVSAAAGLRLVANVLELLDASGTPRLRMEAPYVLGRGGARANARVVLDDCAADRSGAGPWARPVTPPGRATCRVRIGWAGAGVEYPAVLDPVWTAATDTMSAARRAHTATLLDDGRVLVVGGESGATASPTYTATADLFDPGTNTFSPTTPLATARSRHVAVRLSNGDVIVAGGAGASGALATTELYEVATPGFRTVGTLREARQDAAGASTTGGAVMAGGLDDAGGVSNLTEVYSASGETWSVAGNLVSKRAGHVIATTGAGTPVAAGGYTTTSGIDAATAERFVGTTWQSAAAMSQARYHHAGTVLPDGKLLVSGGFSRIPDETTGTAELFDPSANAWSTAGTLAAPRMHHTLTALADGAAVAAGGIAMTGTTISARLRSAEIYLPVTKTWAPLPDLREARHLHTATRLDDGRILLTGGQGATNASNTAEILELDADGDPCDTGSTCRSAFCADGVCCATECEGLCQGCAAAVTGAANGTCAPIDAGLDPRGDCADDGAPSCQQNGLCDGAGACGSYAGTGCTPSACTADADCTSAHCADGICCDTACSGACQSCTAALKGSGEDGACGPTAAGTDPDADCPRLGTGTCAGDATCDGVSACAVPRTGEECAAAACEDGVTLNPASLCSADGTCTAEPVSCNPYRCAAAACTTSCTDDADCAPTAHCQAGECQKAALGEACTAALECESGFCADGVCCNDACDGQCEACDLAGQEGTCGPGEGTPRGGRPACFGEADGPCAGGCDGVVRDGCVYPREETLCGTAAATCESGEEVAERCNGLGVCVSQPRSCEPYTCADGACLSSCASKDDCAEGASCEDGACVSAGGACTAGDAGSAECGAYLCVAGACTTSCSNDDGCAPGARCADGKCARKSGGDDGGCGCRVPGAAKAPPGSAAALGALLAGFALLRRNTRRRPA